MAEEEKISVEDDVSQEESKGSSKKMIIIIVVALLLLGGGGFAGWKYFLAEKPSGDNGESVEEAQESEEKAPLVRIMCEMKPFIVNLLGNQGKRYLKAKIDIEVDDEAIKNELGKRNSELRDAILFLLAGKSFDDISRPGGKIELRTQLVERINGILDQGGIRTLYFTEFVVQ